MNLIVTGASGFAGGEVLRQAMGDAAIARVTVLTRRPLGLAGGKLTEILRNDFLDYSALDFSSYDACIWCLGVSQAQVTEDAYITITCDYAVAAAAAMFAANPGLRFLFVSGQHADPTEKGPRLYRRIKGRTERKLGELSENVFAFRPGYIRPTKQSGPRRDIGRLLAPIGTLISLFDDDYSVGCDQLAQCLLDVAKKGSPEHLLENRAIREWK